MAAAAGSLLKPRPGTLSNGAASLLSAASYGVGFTFGSGIEPTSFSARRTSSVSGEAVGDDADAHLQRQRPAGRVVGTLGRAARVLPEVGILLHVEHLARHRREFLVGRDHPRAFGEASPASTVTGAVSWDTRTPPNASRRSSSRRRPPDRAAAAGMKYAYGGFFLPSAI